MTISALPNHAWEFNGNGNDLVGSYNLTIYGTTDSNGKPTYGLTAQTIALREPTTYNLNQGAWSIAGWIKTDPTNNENELCVIGDVKIMIDPSLDTIHLRRYSTGTGTKTFSTPSVANTWHHLAFTKSAGGVLTAYKNGSSVGTDTFTDFADAGGLISVGDNNGYESLYGQIAVWESAITADDVTYIYNAGGGLAYASWEVTAPPAGNFRRTSNVFSNRFSMRR